MLLAAGCIGGDHSAGSLLVTARPTRVLWVSFGDWRGYWFPALGMHTVAGFARRHLGNRIEQRVWYYDEGDIETFLRHVSRTMYDFIAMSVNLGHHQVAIALAQRVVESVLEDTRESPQLVFGNREYDSDAHCTELLSLLPSSVIVHGEGEVPFTQLLIGTPASQIDGLTHVTGASGLGAIEKRAARPLEPEAYVAPTFDLPLLNSCDLELNQTVAYVELSRGCSKRPACAFCENSRMDRRPWQALSAREVRRSLVNAGRLSPAAVNFVCEDFMGGGPGHVERVLGLIEELREMDALSPETHFYCAVRATDVYCSRGSQGENAQKRHLLERMRSIGFTTLYVGLESGSDAQLHRYAKGTSRIENTRAVETLRALGFHIDGGFIGFDPMMSLNDCRDNIGFLREVKVPKLYIFPFNRLLVFPGTAYSRRLQRHRSSQCAGVERLLSIVGQVERAIPYKRLERFLQALRLAYFTDNDPSLIDCLEHLAITHGEMCLDFLENLLPLLERRPNDQAIGQAVDGFLATYHRACDEMLRVAASKYCTQGGGTRVIGAETRQELLDY